MSRDEARAGREPLPGRFAIINAEVEGSLATVLIADGIVTQLGADVRPSPSDEVFDAQGGAVLPGLNDHHIHLHALAAANASVRCGPPHVDDEADLRTALGAATPSNGWIRGTGYHESVAGPLDRHALDRLRHDVPIRIQHRTGIHWFLNTAALDHLGAALDHEGAERDEDGVTGVLTRMDDVLAEAWPAPVMDLAATSTLLAAHGITGLTDATPTLSGDRLSDLDRTVGSGEVLQRVQVLATDTCPTPHNLLVGPRKVIVDEHALPELGELITLIADTHATGRAVAIHAVTRASLAFVVAALGVAGSGPGDRVEHASVCPQELAEELARLAVVVVTQPNLVHERGDEYLADVDPDDQPWLYPVGLLDRCGVPTGLSTDAPHGDPDPWQAIRAAGDRLTRAGSEVGSVHAVTTRRALDGFLSPLDDPGGPARRIEVGEPAALTILRAPLRDVLAAPSASAVSATVLSTTWVPAR